MYIEKTTIERKCTGEVVEIITQSKLTIICKIRHYLLKKKIKRYFKFKDKYKFV